MTHEQVVKTINQFLVEEFEINPTKIIPGNNLKETLELDSLDYIDLVVIIESNFGFKVKPEDFLHIDTFNDFYEYATHRVCAKDMASY
ncbi:MAG TPA: phosphopantetheine-binding protein [Chitinophagaceae bacterium]|nr:phosphopantetheine-binding protein [Chitinophagaceae bacterium]